MATEDSNIRSMRSSGHFFLFLVALSVGLACVNIYHDRWGMALEFVPGMICFGGIAWRALSGTGERQEPDRGHAPGASGAGVPVPVGPNPRHHLIAAKDLPPDGRTHSFPKD